MQAKENIEAVGGEESLSHLFSEDFSDLIVDVLGDDMKRLSDEDIKGDYRALYEDFFDEEKAKLRYVELNKVLFANKVILDSCNKIKSSEFINKFRDRNKLIEQPSRKFRCTMALIKINSILTFCRFTGLPVSCFGKTLSGVGEEVIEEDQYNRDLIQEGRREYRNIKYTILELEQELKKILQIVQLIEYLTRTGKLGNISKYNNQVNEFAKHLLITTKNIIHLRKEFDDFQKSLSF